MADAGYDATPQTPDATMTSVEVIQMPEDVPPAPEAVVEVQATFGGVTTDDAHDADFQEAIRAAVAEALDVDESQVHYTRQSSVPRVLAGASRPFRSHHARANLDVAARPFYLFSLSLSFSLTHLRPPVAIVSQVIITDVDTDDEGDVVVTTALTPATTRPTNKTTTKVTTKTKTKSSRLHAEVPVERRGLRSFVGSIKT